MITVRFACGHQQDVDPAEQAAPICRVCGELRVQRVTAPAPVFRGAVKGPCVEAR